MDRAAAGPLYGKDLYLCYIIYMEDMGELGEAEVNLASSFLAPSLPDGRPERLAFTSAYLRFLFS